MFATGLINFSPFFGGAVFQIILGAVLDRQGLTADGGFALQGFKYAFLVLFICGLVALTSSLFIKAALRPADMP